MDQIGEYREVEVVDSKTGKKGTARCLEACEDQQNEVAVTTSKLPNRQTMLKWTDFCTVMEKIKKSCSHISKRIELDMQYPAMCTLLLLKLNESHSLPRKGEKSELCKKAFSNFTIFWSARELKTDGVDNSSDEALLNEIFKYARQNLALVNIYIKPPVVKRIMRDERIPVIWFVANCGGILGLCMGFSIVTAFEVLHYLLRLIIHSCYLPFRLISVIKGNYSSKDNEHELCRRSNTANTFVEAPITSSIKLENTEIL